MILCNILSMWCLRVRHEGAGKAKNHLDFMKKNSIGVRNAYYYIEQVRAQIVTKHHFGKLLQRFPAS